MKSVVILLVMVMSMVTTRTSLAWHPRHHHHHHQELASIAIPGGDWRKDSPDDRVREIYERSEEESPKETKAIKAYKPAEEKREPRRLAVSSEETRVLQLRLKAAGFDPGPIDGIRGRLTRRA